MTNLSNRHHKPCRDIKAGAVIILGMLILSSSGFSCASKIRKAPESGAGTLTEEKLYQINDEVRFTRFYYADKVESGLLLRWMPDSVLIQERGQGQPRMIPTKGITTIETVTGNRIMPGIGIGALLAAGYFAAVKGYDLGTVTFWEAVTKLLIPPAILITSIAIGSSMEKRESYKVPPGFIFDYDAVRQYHEAVM